MTEPTTQALIELADKYAEDRHVCGAPVYNEKSAASRQALLDALEAQAREIDRLKKLVDSRVPASDYVNASNAIVSLEAELAAIRAVPVADVNAGLVGKPKCKECHNWREANQANKEWHEDVAKGCEIVSDLARTQQAQKGGV